jgi:hypothetical protein
MDFVAAAQKEIEGRTTSTTTGMLEIWSEWIKSESKFGVVNLFDFLTDNYEPPVKKVSTNNQ